MFPRGFVPPFKKKFHGKAHSSALLFSLFIFSSLCDKQGRYERESAAEKAAQKGGENTENIFSSFPFKKEFIPFFAGIRKVFPAYS
ncbi:MAG: hypothetical protein LKE53_10545 [Oscillospiraceae bacterium]|nr:hypothetical protein [Oscillospiraceae bacterium]MDD3260369.1 hypothetical protein [Oscillospiraceae bacterium]